MGFKALKNATLAVTTATARTAIPINTATDAAGTGRKIPLVNRLRLQADGVDIWFRVGQSDVDAVVNGADSHLVQDNAIEEFNIDPNRDTHIAAICASSSGNLRVTGGSGSD